MSDSRQIEFSTKVKLTWTQIAEALSPSEKLALIRHILNSVDDDDVHTALQVLLLRSCKDRVEWLSRYDAKVFMIMDLPNDRIREMLTPKSSDED